MGIITVYLLVTLSAFFWGANFVLAGPILADLPPLWAAAIRFMLGATLMLVIALVRREEMICLVKRHATIYLILGAAGITGFNLLFFYALQSTSANSAALIMATNPLMTALLAAAFLKERPKTQHLFALPVALMGVVVVISHGKMSQLSSFARGDMLMLGANLSWAMYNVLASRHMPKASAIANTSWIMTAGAILLFLAAMTSDTHAQLPGSKAILSMSVMVIGGTVMAYLFWSIGLARLGAARTAIFLNLIPVFAILIGTFTGAPPSAAQLAGGALVLGGISISMLPPRRLATA